MHLPLTALCACSVLALPAAAQTIVNTGDDLIAVVAAAASGDVIQIHSDATFVGLFDWAGKTLTIEAGPGYTPTLRGPDGNNCLQPTPANPPTIGTFKGLRIEGGPAAPFPGFPVVVMAYGEAAWHTEVTFEDCTLSGRPTFGGTGLSTGKGSFKNTVMEDSFLAYGYETAPLEILLEDCVVRNAFQAFGTSKPLGGFEHVDVTLRRSVFGRGIDLNAIDGGSVNVLAESCVVDGDLEAGTFVPYGVRIFSDVTGSFANVTVTNVATGIQGQPGVTWHNLLIHGNSGASLAGVDLANIDHSLIEDGTYAGLNNNFAGSALWDADYQLLFCSSGLDAGDNAAPGLGATDLNGEPRIQDNDALPGAVINVGATEKSGSVSPAATVVNGSGINIASYIAGTLPVIGGTYSAIILSPPGSPSPVLTMIVVDVAAPPTTSPLWVGELMLALSGAATYHMSPSAVHSIPVPSSCGIVGLTVPTQGFAIHDVSGALVPHCRNRLDLTIGA